MKFNEVQEKSKYIKSNKQLRKINRDLENIFSLHLYNCVAICLMKPGTKGNFKHISTLVNNGIEPASWTIRIFFTNGMWGAQVAPHSEIDKSDINISVVSILDKFANNTDIELFANLHMGTIRSSNENIIEEVVNYLIEELKDKRLKNIETFKIEHRYTSSNSHKRYKIGYSLHSAENIDEQTISKYVSILIKLLSKNLTDKERKKIQFIKNRKLAIEDKKYLLRLSQRYLTQSERIRIAMSYIK